MISLLTGKLQHKAPHYCIIDVGGVGYHVNTSLHTFSMLPELNDNACIHIHTYVREDQLQLFGFIRPEEKELFLKLIAISGVGPKMAMAILSGLPAAELAKAISREDKELLSTIPGVGKKTAERIIIELKDRLEGIYGIITDAEPRAEQSIIDDAVSALTNLGYQRHHALKAINKIDDTEGLKIEELIKKALQELSRI